MKSRDKIMDVAQELVQTRGYNAFSYRDLANTVGVKTSSIHYYFPGKDDLGVALMERYRDGFRQALAAIDRQTDDPRRKLRLFAEIFNRTCHSGRICLGGMLATDLPTLSEGVGVQVRQFFHEGEAWLTRLLKQGRAAGVFRFEGAPAAKAEAIFAAMEGALIAARLFGDEKRLTNALRCVEASVQGR